MYRTFEHTDVRPSLTRRTASEMQGIDVDVEVALYSTLSGGATIIPLKVFHSSPAKGRVFLRGFKLKHRVRGDMVHAWLI